MLASQSGSRRKASTLGQLVEFDLREGGHVLVEVDGPAPGPVTRGGRPAELVTKAGESLEQALGRIGPAVHGIVSELRSSAEWPEEVEVEFAIKLSGDANVIIARSGGEANFRISLRWSRKER
jgi:Trypsin-co-occurring domain 1